MTVQRVLVVTAHPDDVDFAAGGTIAGFTDSGIEVSYCIITDGDAGGIDHTVTRAEVAALRRREQQAAGEVLGVHDIRFLGYKDGELQVSHELRRDITRVIRQVRPDRMLIQSPDRNWKRIYASHPDHMAAAEAAIFAIYPDARNPFAHPHLLQDEGLADWAVPEVWVMGSPTPNHWVDVTDYLDRKIDALRAHHSQTAHMDGMPDRVRSMLEQQAAEAGLATGRLAEAFMIVNTA